jgi:hypothetical protein
MERTFRIPSQLERNSLGCQVLPKDSWQYFAGHQILSKFGSEKGNVNLRAARMRDFISLREGVARSCGCVSAIDSNGRTTWIADAHRDDGKRFVVHADEKLTAFVELEAAIRGCGFLA